MKMALNSPLKCKKASPRRRSPFKATKMWNELLANFKEGMELKRKRYRLKIYDQCFSGAEAMDWLYNYLQDHPNHHNVSKENTLLLLQKFYENNVFQGVSSKICQKFQHTNIYRFVDKEKKSANANDGITTKQDKENFNSRNSLSNLMRTISKRSSRSELILDPSDKYGSLRYKTPIKEHHDPCLNKSGFTPLAKNMNEMCLAGNKDKEENSYSLYSTIILKSDDEDEVFETSPADKLFRSNSLPLWRRGTQPAVRQPLGTLWVNEYEKTKTESVTISKNEKGSKKNLKTFGKSSLNFQRSRRLRKRKSAGELDNDKLQTGKLGRLEEENADVESIDCRTYSESISSTSANHSTSNSLQSVNVSRVRKCSISDHSCTGSHESLSGPIPEKALAILGEDPSIVNETCRSCQSLTSCQDDDDVNSPIHKRSKSESQNEILQSDKCSDANGKSAKLTNIEGAIRKAASVLAIGPTAEKNNILKARKSSLKAQSAMRRSITQSNLKRKESVKISNVQTQGYPFSLEADCMDNRLYKAPSCWSINTIGLSTTDEGEAVSEISVDDVEETWKSVVILSLRKLLGVVLGGNLFDISQVSGANVMKNVSWNPSEIAQDAPPWLLSAMNCVSDWPNISKEAEDTILQDFPNYPGFEVDVYRAIKEHYHTTLSKPLIPYHLYPLVQRCSDLVPKDYEVSVKIMQHIILLLPCWNRRQLQLIVLFMKRVSTNSLLQLSKDLSNRDLVINSFLQMITRKGEEEFTLVTAMGPIRILNLLVDSYDLVFKAPPNLRGQVDHKLAMILGKPDFSKQVLPSTIPSIPVQNDNPSYCKKISMDAYEEEAKENYRNAINDLLTTYMTDPCFTEKERRRRLKQFKKAYPDIYAKRIACDSESNCSSISEFSTKFKENKPSFFDKG